MTDVWHQFGSDLVISANGDLLTASGADETTQRVIRRLFTNLGGYIWDMDYGAGLPSKVGSPISAPALQAITLAQMQMESGVGISPPPVVGVTKDVQGYAYLNVTYTDAVTLQPVPLSLTLG